MKYGYYMERMTLTEEINRIIQINEYGYDYDDVSRQSLHKPIDVSDLSGKNINKNVVTKWLSRQEEEARRKEMNSKKGHRQNHLLDINNHKDRMVIFNYLSKRNNINKATEETLKIIEPLRYRMRYAAVHLSIDSELELEFGFYLLKFNKYGIRYGFGFGFDGLHLSSTFNNILNNEQSGFKRKIEPSFEDFKNFITTNKEIFEKEIKDYINNHK